MDSFRVGGGLSHDIISLMIDCGMLLDNAKTEGVKGASYDLLLGDEYYYDGKIKRLTGTSSFLTIEPYDYAIVSCKERARIPRDVIGKFGLTVGLFCQGIILSNGPQIDPGFNGTLFCLLFNRLSTCFFLCFFKSAFKEAFFLNFFRCLLTVKTFNVSDVNTAYDCFNFLLYRNGIKNSLFADK